MTDDPLADLARDMPADQGAEFARANSTLAYLDSLAPAREVVKATVAAFVADGFSEEQARSLTVDILHQAFRPNKDEDDTP